MGGHEVAHFVGISVVTYISEVLITKGYALATQGANSVAVYKFLTPIFALAFGVVFYGEIPNALNILGALVVVSSSAMMVYTQATAPSKQGDLEDKWRDDAESVSTDESE